MSSITSHDLTAAHARVVAAQLVESHALDKWFKSNSFGESSELTDAEKALKEAKEAEKVAQAMEQSALLKGGAEAVSTGIDFLSSASNSGFIASYAAALQTAQSVERAVEAAAFGNNALQNLNQQLSDVSPSSSGSSALANNLATEAANNSISSTSANSGPDIPSNGNFAFTPYTNGNSPSFVSPYENGTPSFYSPYSNPLSSAINNYSPYSSQASVNAADSYNPYAPPSTAIESNYNPYASSADAANNSYNPYAAPVTSVVKNNRSAPNISLPEKAIVASPPQPKPAPNPPPPQVNRELECSREAEQALAQLRPLMEELSPFLSKAENMVERGTKRATYDANLSAHLLPLIKQMVIIVNRIFEVKYSKLDPLFEFNRHHPLILEWRNKLDPIYERYRRVRSICNHEGYYLVDGNGRVFKNPDYKP